MVPDRLTAPTGTGERPAGRDQQGAPEGCVRNVPDQGMNDTPSSEVKHCALEKVPVSASPRTTPLGWMNSRPLVASHMSTGTYTSVAGRNAFGRVNGTELLPVVAMAPLKWTIPETLLTADLEVPKGALVQPFLRVSGVGAPALAWAAPAPRAGRMTAVAHKAPAAISRSRFTSPRFRGCTGCRPSP